MKLQTLIEINNCLVVFMLSIMLMDFFIVNLDKSQFSYHQLRKNSSQLNNLKILFRVIILNQKMLKSNFKNKRDLLLS